MMADPSAVPFSKSISSDAPSFVTRLFAHCRGVCVVVGPVSRYSVTRVSIAWIGNGIRTMSFK